MKFLLLRQDSKSVILKVCRQMLLPGQQANLSVIAKVLDMLNKVYQRHLEKEVQVLVSAYSNTNSHKDLAKAE